MNFSFLNLFQNSFSISWVYLKSPSRNTRGRCSWTFPDCYHFWEKGEQLDRSLANICPTHWAFSISVSGTAAPVPRGSAEVWVPSSGDWHMAHGAITWSHVNAIWKLSTQSRGGGFGFRELNQIAK